METFLRLAEQHVQINVMLSQDNVVLFADVAEAVGQDAREAFQFAGFNLFQDLNFVLELLAGFVVVGVTLKSIESTLRRSLRTL